MIKPRLLLLATASILISTTANASLESQIAQCAKVQDKLERLICFDNLAAALPQTTDKQQTNNLAAPVAATTTVIAANNESTQDNFGKVKKTAADELSKIYLEVEAVAKDAYGAKKITFSNGQVWKQTDSRSFKINAEQKVFIKKAAFGSYMLGTDDRNTTIRVKRLK